jgi:hypothetical protein
VTLLIDVRETNVANLIRFTERSRGWKVEPEEFLRDLDAAVAADREALSARAGEAAATPESPQP